MVKEIWIDADGREHKVCFEEKWATARRCAIYCPNCHTLEEPAPLDCRSIEALRSELTARGWSRKEETVEQGMD